jgi:arylsulfatase A-like enzyme
MALPQRSVATRLFSLCVAIFVACSPPEGALPVLTADMPLHLEDHIADARVTGSMAPAAGQAMEWSFDEPQPAWLVVRAPNPVSGLARVEKTGDALRITLTEATRRPDGVPVGGVSIEVPPSIAADWGDVNVRVRSDSTVTAVGMSVNAGGTLGPPVPLVRDGTIQTYRLRWPGGPNVPQVVQPWIAAGSPVHSLGVYFQAADGPGSVDLLSVSVPPVGEAYRDPPLGMRKVADQGRSRRALYTHAPSRLEFRVTVPEGGRLDTGLRVLRPDAPVTFRVTVQPPSGQQHVVTEELVSESTSWLQRSVDLSEFANRAVTLVLENDSPNPGAVGLWSAPTLTGSAEASRPNVIFYVIDGGGADQMSLYGYNRNTTPNLDAIAAEGAVFEWAYSNASWSKPSTTSFMTSLQNSVLGNTKDGQFDPLPAEAKTMSERFHEGGYQTAVFTSNPWAGSFSSLDRGADVFRDAGAPVTTRSRSSVQLHQEFWDWREAYPGSPYWVHFQTTDVHRPTTALPPFAGLFASPGTDRLIQQQDSAMNAWWEENEALRTADSTAWAMQWEEAGVDRLAYFAARRDVYDETLAHQDHQLGKLVERLKLTGDWENTLLVVAADHSIWAGNVDFLGGMHDVLVTGRPPVMLRSSVSRVPLVIVWPGRIEAGQRIREPVSMIDVLPTVLDLAGLPAPEVLQGQSLAPLLLEQPGWEPRPIILDEFDSNPTTGELSGRIEVIDGRWGASLWIGSNSADRWQWWLEDTPRSWPLLLYDIAADPLALDPVNDRYPELVAHYTEFLTRQSEAHQLLAQRFTPGGALELTAEQLETLRTLGYIR